MKLSLRRVIWKISACEDIVNDEPFFWQDFLDNNMIAFGDYGEGDISKYSREGLKNKLIELGKSSQTIKFYLEFRDEVELGDIVVVYARETIFGIGYIFGDYYYKRDNLGKTIIGPRGGKYGYKLGIPNRRKVKWIVTDGIPDERLDILKKPQLTFFKLSNEQEEVVIRVLKDNEVLDATSV